jgi:hypothetical protein
MLICRGHDQQRNASRYSIIVMQCEQVCRKKHNWSILTLSQGNGHRGTSSHGQFILEQQHHGTRRHFEAEHKIFKQDKTRSSKGRELQMLTGIYGLGNIRYTWRQRGDVKDRWHGSEARQAPHAERQALNGAGSRRIAGPQEKESAARPDHPGRSSQVLRSEQAVLPSS